MTYGCKKDIGIAKALYLMALLLREKGNRQHYGCHGLSALFVVGKAFSRTVEVGSCKL